MQNKNYIEVNSSTWISFSAHGYTRWNTEEKIVIGVKIQAVVIGECDAPCVWA